MVKGNTDAMTTYSNSLYACVQHVCDAFPIVHRVPLLHVRRVSESPCSLVSRFRACLASSRVMRLL